MSSDAWLTLGVGILTALAALAGGMLSSIVSAKRQRIQWLQERRAEASERFFADLRRAIYETYDNTDPPALDNAMMDLLASSNVLQIYASDRLSSAVETCTEELRRIIKQAKHTAATKGEAMTREDIEGSVQEVVKMFVALRKRILEEIRMELGTKKLR